MPSFIKIHWSVSSLELFEVNLYWDHFPSLRQLNRPIGKFGTEELVFHRIGRSFYRSHRFRVLGWIAPSFQVGFLTHGNSKLWKF